MMEDYNVVVAMDEAGFMLAKADLNPWAYRYSYLGHDGEIVRGLWRESTAAALNDIRGFGPAIGDVTIEAVSVPVVVVSGEASV